MYRFSRREPLDLTVFPEPPNDDRTGPPLSQGFVLTLIGTVTAEYCTPETLAAIEQIDPGCWYHGQLLESVLNEFEERDPALPVEVGKNIYYSLRSQFTAMGMRTPADVVTTLPAAWLVVTRGDSGEWRSKVLGPGKAHVEAEQPYNCLFEQGALEGALEAFDASDVRIAHTTCMRRGDRCCTFDVTWNDPA
jgi:hypothetical protein